MHAGRRGGRGAGPWRPPPRAAVIEAQAIHSRRHCERIPDRGPASACRIGCGGRAGMVSPPVERGADDTNPLPRALRDHVPAADTDPARLVNRVGAANRWRSRHDPVSRGKIGQMASGALPRPLLLDTCRSRRIPLIVNDDPVLAAEIGADGVHVGRDDGDPRSARRIVGGNDVSWGVSCYDRPRSRAGPRRTTVRPTWRSEASSRRGPSRMRPPPRRRSACSWTRARSSTYRSPRSAASPRTTARC